MNEYGSFNLMVLIFLGLLNNILGWHLGWNMSK